MWFRWMILAFITNGLCQFGVRVMQDMGLAKTHSYLYLGFWYLAGLVFALITFLVARQRLLPREVLLGGLMGLFSAGQWFLISGSLSHGMNGFVAFPVAIGGSLSLVSLVGVVVFKERLSSYGYCGVLAGIVSVVLLSTL